METKSMKQHMGMRAANTISNTIYVSCCETHNVNTS